MNPINVERITAREYLDAEARAESNVADKPALRQISEQLALLPKTRERLAFDLLALARWLLERGDDPLPAAFRAFLFRESIARKRISEYVTALEQFIVRVFQLVDEKADRHQQRASLHFALSAGLTTLRALDEERYRTIFSHLRDTLPPLEFDCRLAILDESGEPIAKKKMRIGKLAKQARLEHLKYQQRLKSDVN